MYSRKTVIQNPTGLHARPASEFISCANKFESKISLIKFPEEEKVNAKSIVMLLSLAMGPGTEVEIIAKGSDEVDAVDTLVALIESRFGE